VELADLTLATFAPRVGDRFTIAGATNDGAPIALELESATQRGERPGGRDPFSLVFRGPPEPVLAQAIYALAHGELGTLEIFIVPVARSAETVSYEAVFT
jgi:hypothetical protein